MPPKKESLYCLVHGDPESSVFGIKYDKNTTVDELKEAVYNKRKNAFANLDYPNLTLYQVNIDLTTQNPQRTALGNPNAKIVNDMGGQVLSPIDTIGEKFTTLASRHIHVIVEFPASPAVSGTKRKADEELVDDIREIKKDLKDLKKERSAVNISSVNREDWEKIQAHTGLKFNIIEPNVGSKSVKNIPTFNWNDLPERAQKDRYLPHLQNTVLRLASTNRNVELVDTTNQNNYLDTLSDLLPIKLNGTTHAAVSDRRSVETYLSEFNMRILFELKKVVVRVNVFQAVAELIAADLKSQYPVLAVLTDLNDHWQFFCLGEGKRVTTFITTRGPAVALLRNEVTNTQGTQANTGEAEQQLSRRMKFVDTLRNSTDPTAPTTSTSTAPTDYNVSSDIAPMEDFFDTMTEEEIFKYKAKRILTQFFSQPIFNELDIQRKLPLQADAENNRLY